MTQAQTQQKTYFDPHGYFFVRLPEVPSYRRKLATRMNRLTDEQGHELIPLRGPSATDELLSGVLTCSLFCITPVHIGSGSYRHDLTVPGSVVADIVRDPSGNPIIPGSSLKGSFRAIAEAASRSCLLMKGTDSEAKEKLPGRVGFRGRWNQHFFRPSSTSHWATVVEPALLQAGRNVPVDVETLPDLSHDSCNEANGLCPCCAIFGRLGYRGHIAFTDAHVVDHITPLSTFTPSIWVSIPSRNSPQPHRLADKDTWASGGLDLELLFAVGQHFQNDLQQGDLSERFRQEFKKHGIDLPAKLTIENIKPGITWKAIDYTKRRVYIVSKKDQALNIYSGRKLLVPHPLGRKFYPHWDPHGLFKTANYNWSLLHQELPNGQALNLAFYQQMQQQYGSGTRVPSLYDAAAFQNGEPHDVLPIGTVLEFRLHFQSLLPWELGLVLSGMGLGTDWLPKVGGAKAYGLGSVFVQYQSLDLVSDIFSYASSSTLSEEQSSQKIDECLTAFREHPSCHADGLADLSVGFSLDLLVQQQNDCLHVAITPHQ